jgi:hypothetical protein
VSTLKLKPSQWKKIRADLQTEYPKTVFMIRDKMRRVLGFTVRDHSGYRMRTPKELAEYDRSDNLMYETENDSKWHRLHTMDYFIALDFYSEKKYTMFLLKYSEYING